MTQGYIRHLQHCYVLQVYSSLMSSPQGLRRITLRRRWHSPCGKQLVSRPAVAAFLGITLSPKTPQKRCLPPSNTATTRFPPSYAHHTPSIEAAPIGRTSNTKSQPMSDTAAPNPAANASQLPLATKSLSPSANAVQPCSPTTAQDTTAAAATYPAVTAVHGASTPDFQCTVDNEVPQRASIAVQGPSANPVQHPTPSAANRSSGTPANHPTPAAVKHPSATPALKPTTAQRPSAIPINTAYTREATTNQAPKAMLRQPPEVTTESFLASTAPSSSSSEHVHEVIDVAPTSSVPVKHKVHEPPIHQMHMHMITANKAHTGAHTHVTKKCPTVVATGDAHATPVATTARRFGDRHVIDLTGCTKEEPVQEDNPARQDIRDVATMPVL